MPVPSTITDLSVTASSNSPAGTEVVTSAMGPDEYFRALSAIVKREQSQATAVASAATVDLGAIATGNYVHITGITAITGFGTVAAGISRTLVFDGILTLTHNATSLILPGGANITTAAGDVAVMVSEGAGNWRCKSFQSAGGYAPAITGGYQPTITGGATTITGSNLTASRALVSDASGKVGVALVTATELGYLDGVTSAIQTQFSNKQPLDAQLTTLAALSAAQVSVLTATADGTLGAFGHRNKIINNNFAVNQRAVSGTVVLAAGAYGHDRWKAGAGGCTYTFATSANVTTMTISAGTLMQVIEGANLQSGTHVLTWTGTATARVDAGAYGASGLTGTAVGGTNQTIEFATGTVSKVQYEPGSVATPFEHRPIGAELALCQRYYELLGTTVGPDNRPYIDSWEFAVVKRAIPTLAVNAGAANGATFTAPAYNGGASFRCGAVATALSDIQISASAEL